MNERLKKLIFKKLYEDLSQVEIIHYDESIWFIDRKKKYWYFEYDKSGILYWRYGFFSEFFKIFSLDKGDEYQPIICEWVEEVLNYKVNTSRSVYPIFKRKVEEVLNYKVNTPTGRGRILMRGVEEVLNCKVHTAHSGSILEDVMVEDVLNHETNTTDYTEEYNTKEVKTIGFSVFDNVSQVEQILNQ